MKQVWFVLLNICQWYSALRVLFILVCVLYCKFKIKMSFPPLFQMPVCLLPRWRRITGVMWHTGSFAPAWAACTQFTTRLSASSTTYLRVQAYVWACCPSLRAPLPSSAPAARSATASSSAKSPMEFGPTTAVSTLYLSIRPLWSITPTWVWRWGE